MGLREADLLVERDRATLRGRRRRTLIVMRLEPTDSHIVCASCQLRSVEKQRWRSDTGKSRASDDGGGGAAGGTRLRLARKLSSAGVPASYTKVLSSQQKAYSESHSRSTQKVPE